MRRCLRVGLVGLRGEVGVAAVPLAHPSGADQHHVARAQRRCLTGPVASGGRLRRCRGSAGARRCRCGRDVNHPPRARTAPPRQPHLPPEHPDRAGDKRQPSKPRSDGGGESCHRSGASSEHRAHAAAPAITRAFANAPSQLAIGQATWVRRRTRKRRSGGGERLCWRHGVSGWACRLPGATGRPWIRILARSPHHHVDERAVTCGVTSSRRRRSRSARCMTGCLRPRARAPGVRCRAGRAAAAGIGCARCWPRPRVLPSV